MRVHYTPITENQWIQHYQRGSGFIGSPYQRGAGLGSIFRTLFRAILPVAKSAGKAIGKRALKAGAELASDLVAGKNLKESATRRGKEATSELLQRAANKMKGGRRKRKRGTKKAKQRGGRLGQRSIKGKRKQHRQVIKRVKTQLGVIRV